MTMMMMMMKNMMTMMMMLRTQVLLYECACADVLQMYEQVLLYYKYVRLVDPEAVRQWQVMQSGRCNRVVLIQYEKRNGEDRGPR